MASYLLLRDNKESGPYSLDDLMTLGLKAYDLVWIQGKSAAWRYPSEVEELKPIAPIVEEQPYDRFYKKSSDQNKEEVIKREEPVFATEHEKYLPKKSVFVTMPGQKQAQPQPVQSLKKEEPISSYTPQPQAQPTIIVSENPAAQVKYSQPLDEIKEMYVRTLHDRKQKIARKGFLLLALKKAAVVVFLVIVGVIAGFVMKSDGKKQEELAQVPLQAQVPISEPAEDTVARNSAGNSAEDVQELPAPNGGYVNPQTTPQEKQVNESRARALNNDNNSNKTSNNQTMKKESQLTPAEDKLTSGFVASGIETDPTTGERNRKVRSENGNAGKNIKSLREDVNPAHDLSSMVSVSSNEYKKVAFGGIRNLELTVTNDSKHTLDKVIVELQYLKPSEQPLRTENIQFKSVEPGTTSTVKIPDTNRGIKITYRIISIQSREMDETVTGK